MRSERGVSILELMVAALKEQKSGKFQMSQLAAQKSNFAAGSTAEPLRNVYIRRKGSLLGFVLDAPVQDSAEKLLDGIRYESVVTWNERAPSPQDSIGGLMLAAFALTGFLLLVTLVAGISFGGIRYLAKKFLPWAVFDRPSQMEIIRLNLSDK